MLLKLPENCIFSVFEYCEIFGGAMYLALCNQYLYSFAFGRIDLRYRESYIGRHDELASQLLSYNKCLLRNEPYSNCECTFANCRERFWSKIVVKWCKEGKSDLLSRIPAQRVRSYLLFQFPTAVLASYGDYIVKNFSYDVMQYGSKSTIRKYLAVCYRLGMSLKKKIRRHKFHMNDEYIDDELCDYIIMNFTGFSPATFARSTLIDKHDYLKNVAGYCPEYEAAFDDIDVVEKHLLEGSLKAKLEMFIAMQRIDCIILSLRMEPECAHFTFVKEFLAHSTNRKIMKILPTIQSFRSVIHECIMTHTYHNYEFWHDQEVILTPHEINCAKNSISVPRAIFAQLPLDHITERIIMERDDYGIFCDKVDIFDENQRLMWLKKLTSSNALKIIDRIIAQFGMTPQTYEAIISSKSPFNYKPRWTLKFITTYSTNLRKDLNKVLQYAIFAENHDLFDIVFPMTDFDEYFVNLVVCWGNLRAFRKLRRFSDKWEEQIAKNCGSRRGFCCIFHHYAVVGSAHNI